MKHRRVEEGCARGFSRKKERSAPWRVGLDAWFALRWEWRCAVLRQMCRRERRRRTPRSMQQLAATADGAVQIRTRAGTGRVGFIQSGRSGDLLPARAGAEPKAKAVDFLTRYAQLLGVESDSTLVETASETDAGGATHITYAQRYKGLPVFGARSRRTSIPRATSRRSTGPPCRTSTSPSRLAFRRSRRPRGRSRRSASETHGSCRAAGRVRGPRGLPDRPDPRRRGNEPARLPGRRRRRRRHPRDGVRPGERGQGPQSLLAAPDALHRVLYEQNTANKVWEEGDPFPGALNLDQRNIVTFSGDAYRLFSNAFGRDSYDGAGAFMRAVNNDPTHRLPECQLERHHDELLQRRDRRRRRRARVGPRVHRVHPQPDLPVAAGRTERVLLGHLGRGRRPDQRRGHRLAGHRENRGNVHLAHGTGPAAPHQQPGGDRRRLRRRSRAVRPVIVAAGGHRECRAGHRRRLGHGPVDDQRVHADSPTASRARSRSSTAASAISPSR